MKTVRGVVSCRRCSATLKGKLLGIGIKARGGSEDCKVDGEDNEAAGSDEFNTTEKLMAVEVRANILLRV